MSDKCETASDTDRLLLQLAPADNVCVVTATVEAGQRLMFRGKPITAAARIPLGHKVAVGHIARGGEVIKYGLPIGSATRPIAPGEHVHTHNLTSNYIPTFPTDGLGGHTKET